MWFSVSIGRLDRSFITGFLEGEASFTISEQNGGQSYSCGLTVAVRDDDQDLLVWLLAVTGLGRLHRIPQYRTSRPQVGWRIDSQDQCCELLDLVETCGFHGRRASELAVWRDAVDAWTTSHGEARRNTLSLLKARLQRVRRFRAGAARAVPLTGRAERLGYVSGLVSAEGSFGMGGGRPRFAIHLRGDDRPLLDLLSRTTGLGTVSNHMPVPPLNPSSTWTVGAAAQLEQLIELLRLGGLSGRKRTEMEAWAVAVNELCSARRDKVRPRRDVIERAARDLAGLRVYRPPARDELPRVSERDLRADSIDALRRWSRTRAGPLSCLSYTRWREPTDPGRNTIARQFGGWHVALEAAGLGGRGARAPHPAGGLERRLRRREVQKERVIRAVLRCGRDLGRPPRAMEFFRWRLHAAPDTPTQGTVYSLFPGGWTAVLEACASCRDPPKATP